MRCTLGYKALMGNWLHDQRVFWRQFRQEFHTTGAVLPSGRFLAAALARFVGHETGTRETGTRETGTRETGTRETGSRETGSRETGGQRILEVGPGTGAVTSHIVRRLGRDDRLDLVELNAQFVERLNQRFASEEPFRAVAPQARVLHCPLQDLPLETPYDLLISGLPLNNFSVEDVEQILDVMTRLVRPGGTLSFFEYIAIRPLRALVSGRSERARLRGIGQALGRLLQAHEIRRDWIWPNVPPAWVHHVRLPSDGGNHQARSSAIG